ncbi:MAG: SWIM zinc finger domain-containing protein [Deltaproteobacteria bacterium]|nr:SWIM zinc finger domain-containing protein [Deltaproteobacteria bacterium]
MPNKKTPLDRFSDLTWNDIEAWVGGKIVSRGKNYQQQGRVSDLAVTDDGSLIAWVDGSERYATRVVIDEDGLPDSICTCPYERDCKHGVAVVIEYLKRVEDNRSVPKAKQDDDRLKLLADEDRDAEPNDAENGMSEDLRQDIDAFLKGKTKAQLIDLIHDLAGQYPEMARELGDRKQVISGNTEPLVKRLRQEIHDLGEEPGWRNHWNNEGYTPNYSKIRQKLETLLKAGHTDEVLTLGLELVETGTRQVEESDDEGETEMEIAACMPVVVEALERSPLEAADKLAWALDVLLEDQYELCEAFGEYLHRGHPPTAWHTLADRLLTRLHGLKRTKGADDFSRNYERDRLSDWAIHALDQAGRKKEIIPLCIAEAQKTVSYERLVKRLVEARRYDDAEKWIKEGTRHLGPKWPGITAGLRGSLLEIRTLQQNWPVVAALQVEEFVRHPSLQAFRECKIGSDKARIWPQVRESLLRYLEKGELPWTQKGWPLPESGLARPDTDQRIRFPLVGNLIDIAILEKKPDQVLKWYDQRPKGHFRWLGADEDTIATAVQGHAPDRAVAIWKNKAERLIAQVKPSAYQEAVKFLRKAGDVMSKQNKQAQWDQYLRSLRDAHARKRRLIEILDGLEGKPIINKKLRI